MYDNSALVVKTWAWEVHFLPEERRHLRFSFICPKCGKKNSLDGIKLAGFFDKERGFAFWYIPCNNRKCKYEMAEVAYRRLLMHMEKLKAEHPFTAKKVESYR